MAPRPHPGWSFDWPSLATIGDVARVRIRATRPVTAEQTAFNVSTAMRDGAKNFGSVVWNPHLRQHMALAPQCAPH